MNFEEAARQLGIPADRIELVKRNIELKAKLAERGRCMLGFGQTLHDIVQHGGDFATCTRDSCNAVRVLVARTEAT